MKKPRERKTSNWSKDMRKNLIIRVVLIFAVVGMASCSAKYGSYVLDPVPKWYQHWLRRDFLDAEKFRQEGYSTLEAMEIQNSALAMIEKNKDLKFADAVYAAKKRLLRGEAGASGYLPPKNMGEQDFIVALDLDETVLGQWYRNYSKGREYADVCTGVKDIAGEGLESSECITLVPKIGKALENIAGIPGFKGFVIFSAKQSKASDAILNSWQISGKPARLLFMGVFTRGYLTRGGNILAPSKDLRIIDETLKHVVMIDDSPDGIVQAKNLRVFPKFNPDLYFEARDEDKQNAVLKYYEGIYKIITDELIDTSEYARKNNQSFVEAFYPYSHRGSYCRQMIQETFSYSEKAAANFLRDHKKLCEPEFYGVKPGNN
jgi:hypothetical protein